MNIQVRVAAAQALKQMQQMQAQIAATRAQVAQLQRQQAAGSAATAVGAAAGIGSPRSTKNLGAWGNQLQWTGRQLQYNFTLPLLLAGGAAAKFQLDNEKAFTQVSKVYGDTQAAAAQYMKEQKGLTEEMATQQATATFAAELEALGDAFEALSSHYGVQQKAVLEVAGAWAAAGESGVGLAKSTELSLQASILGSFDAVKATESLIAIQAQYSLSTDQLGETLATLNAIENQTGISMQGLIEGFARSAGVAREAGVDIRHLGAFLAAMSPAAGSAAQAGNALKTIISRLMSPTAEASQVMKEMGLNINNVEWQSSTATERLLIMSKSFGELSDSQKQVASSVIASRWQINKFNVLMREISSNTGFYTKALDATIDRSKIFTQMQKELNTVLQSSPQRLNQIWYSLQNAAADIIQPMIPYIIYLAGEIKDLVTAFSELDPQLQKIILVALLLVAVVGPLIRYIGTTATMFFELARGALFVLKPLKLVWSALGLIGTVLGSIGSAGAAVKGVFAAIGAAISGSGAIGAALMILPAMAKQIFAFNFKVARFIFAEAIIQGIMASANFLLKGILGTLVVPIRMGVAQALLNLGALVGIFQMVFGRIVAVIASSKITAAIAGMILQIMRLGMVTGPLTGLWATMGMAWERIWGAMYVAFMRTFGLLPRIAAATAAGVQAIWAMFGARMIMLQVGMQARMIAVAAFLNTKMTAVFAAISRSVLAIWAVMNTRLLQMWTATQILLLTGPARFLAFMRGIPARMAIIGRQIAVGFVAALPAILAFIRVWGPKLLKLLTGPWGLAIGAVVGIVYSLRDQIVTVWNNIIEYFGNSNNGLVRGIIGAWNLLPEGVANALTAVARIVRDAALQIYEWFSYINPFARHSPSLVENVTAGMAAVRAQFANTASIGRNLKGAYSDIKAFGTAIAHLVGNVDSLKHADDRAAVAKFAPGAIQEFDALARRVTQLKGNLEALKTQVDAQQASVDRWEAALDAANKALDIQQDKLSDLNDIADKYQAQLDEANNRLQNFASAPIAGMGAMEDAIFANDQAQKKLRLEMMKMEDVTGPLDDIKSKIEAINGAQELLRGEQANLRAGGAGSEILSGYDAEIAKLEAQKGAYGQAADKIDVMQNALEKLQRDAERMDLEKSLKFDPLTRAIEKAANAMKELPFDEIMAGIKGAQADVKLYQDRLTGVNAAIDQQKKAVEAATLARDAIQDSLDRESEKLDTLKDKYSEVEGAIRDVEEAMNTAVSAAGDLQQRLDEAARKKKEAAGAKEYISPGLANFRAAEGGEFADVGGAGTPLRTDWKSQEADIKKFTDDLSRQTAEMFKNINPFKGFGGKFNEFKTWLSQVWASLWGGLVDMWNHIWEGVDFGPAVGATGNFFDKVGGLFSKGIDALKSLWRLFGPDIVDIFQNIWKGVVKIWDQVGPELAKFGELLRPIGQMFQNIWTVAKPVLALIIGGFLLLAKVILSIVADTIEPILSTVGGILTALVRIIRGAVQVIVGIFTLDLGMISEGVANIFSGLFKTVGEIISGAVQVIWGIIKGLVQGIWNFFQWLYDELVGHSIVPDTVNGVVWYVKKLASLPKWVWDNVLKPLWDKFLSIWNNYLKPGLTWIMAALITLLKLPYTIPKWLWDNVLIPIYNKFKQIYNEYLAPYVDGMMGGIRKRWEKLKNIVKWVQDNFIDPIKSAFSTMVDAIGKIWDKLQSKIEGPIGAVKKWVNDNLIAPLNKVVKLFGLTIPTLSTGGPVTTGQGHNLPVDRLRDGGRVRGFSSSSTQDNVPIWATANEYMQPVSTVRHYGLGVMDAIRHKQIPKEVFSNKGYFLGGLIDGAMNKVQDWMEKGPEYAVNQIMNPAIGMVGKAFPAPEFVNKTAVGSVTATRDAMLKWIQGAGGTSGPMPTNPGLAGAQAWAQSQAGKPYIWGGVGPNGYDCSGFMSAIANYIQGRPLYQRRFATGSMPAGVFAPGPGAFSVAWFRGNPGHTAGTLNGMNVESRGGRGVVVGSQARGAADPLFNSGIYHLPGYAYGGRIGDPPFDLLNPKGKAFNPAFPDYYSGYNLRGLQDGAIIKGGQGGTPVLVGEGSRDELIKPLPPGFGDDKPGSGDTIIEINGNLEFPNITSGDDVEDLIEDLKVLAGDYE